MTTLAVLQPGYLPWLGYFDQMLRADVFLHYDTAQFDKNGWRNRNRIPNAHGVVWLTVPVLQHLGTALSEVRIAPDPRWKRKHLDTMRQAYARSDVASTYLDGIEAVLSRPWERLLDLDIALVDLIAAWLEIDTRVGRVSDFDVRGERSGKLVELCRAVGATRYLTGDAAKSYLDTAAFDEAGIEVEWQRYPHPVYPQFQGCRHTPSDGGFIPFMSIVDLLMNCGPSSAAILREVAARPGSAPDPSQTGELEILNGR